MENTTQKHSKRPNDFVLGLLTAHAHQIPSESIGEVKFSEGKHVAHNQKLNGWKICDTFGNSTKSEFFAVLYECEENQQAVLAFRGYIDQTDKITNAKMLKIFFAAIEKSLKLQDPWYEATERALKLMRENEYLLTFTGHAFGACLAELAIFYCHKVQKCNFVDNLKAVTFESPGIYAQIEEQQTNLVNSTPDVIPYLNIVTYLSAPNLLNVTHRHIGKIYQLCIDKELEIPNRIREKVKKYKYLSAILAMKGCDLDTMLDEFDSETGIPRKYLQMADWPTIKYDQSAFISGSVFDTGLECVESLLPERVTSLIKVALPVFQRFLPSIQVASKLVTGKISLEQLFDSKDPKKITDILDKYFNNKSHYVVESEEPNLKESPVPHFPGTLEWYLWKLCGSTEQELNNSFESDTKDKLMVLKRNFRVLPPDHSGQRIIETIGAATVEDVKDEMRHLLKDCDNLLEYLSDVETETLIETRILQMQHKGYECSVSNVMEAERKRNFELIPNLENLYNLLKTEDIKDYFMSNDVSPVHLAKFLYTFNVLANFTLYHKHDGKKTRDILETAKILAEQYMRRTPEFPENFNFDEMEDAGVNLVASKVNEDLLSMYTVLIYFQGRSYIYENEVQKLAEGKKCFEICRKLGNKLNMFEGFLSIGRGTLVLELLEIESKMKVGQVAIEQLRKSLDTLQALKTDANAYIVGYKPGERNGSKVKPSEDLYNLIECNEQELRHCYFLMNLTTDPAQINECVEKVRQVFTCIFKLLKENQKMNPRKKTSVYNMVGFTFLSLFDKRQDLAEFRSQVTEVLGDSFLIKANELIKQDLFFIKAIFRLAKPKWDGEIAFTVAETYDGLYKVNERLLELKDLRETEYDDILESLTDCRNKRDEINEKLKRNKNK